MAARNVRYYLVKCVRITGWALLALGAAYLLSGYATCGKLSLGAALRPREAMGWHKALDIPFIALFLAHAAPAAYLALRRWGWIGPKAKP
ncbi:MAG: hypothetical protein ACYS5V_07365 [Planctomycetota bacterium]